MFFRIKHNAPMKEVADASVLVLRANKARATGYIDLIQMAQPELYLTLQVCVVSYWSPTNSDKLNL